MALRDKLRSRSQPFLEPGELIQEVLLLQAGPNPWLIPVVGPLIMAPFTKYQVAVATDRAVVLLRASMWMPAKPKGLVARLPRSTRLDPSGRLWGKAKVNGRTHYIHRRFFKDCAAADAGAGAGTGGASAFGTAS